MKTTINQQSYQNEEHSKESNLPELCRDVIKAIDVTQILANNSKYALIEAADLDKHIMWTLNHDEKNYDVESDILEKGSVKDQSVINNSGGKDTFRMVNSDAVSSRKVNSDDSKQTNVVLYNNYSQSASRIINSDV